MILKPVFLYGPPGVGKTTLGKLLAEDLDLPFIDLDQQISVRAGMSISQIFSSQGEAHFRALEKQALRDIAHRKQCIVSLGGGCLLDEDNRDFVFRTGIVICLMAALETLENRISVDRTSRPLLDAQPANNLDRLYKLRQGHYLSFQNLIHVDHKTTSELLWEAQTILKVFSISGMSADYQVYINENAIDLLMDHLLALNLTPPYFLITDTNLAAHYHPFISKINTSNHTGIPSWIFPAGENSKNIFTIQKIWDAMLSAQMDRGGTVLALGGGVTGDMAGFAAATYMRGIAWVNLPTSLLAMVDSSLGGKTGVDLPQGKNLIGAFHPPKMIITDPSFLKTLPDEEFRNGMAEVIKHTIIGDRKLFEMVQKGEITIRQHLPEMISHAVGVKARIIVKDPYEQGLRECLNFGHTIGHAVEKLMSYQIGHGSAVSIGMVMETWLAEQIGLAHTGLVDEIKGLLSVYGLPTSIPSRISAADLINAMYRDKKKRQDRLHFSLPKAIGQVQVKIHIPDLNILIEKKLEQ